MIDESKYTGHTEGPWTLYTTASHGPTIAGKLNDADWQLIADAPLLLAEVKRLYELIFHVNHKLEYYFDEDEPFVKNLDLLENMYNRGEEE